MSSELPARRKLVAVEPSVVQPNDVSIDGWRERHRVAAPHIRRLVTLARGSLEELWIAGESRQAVAEDWASRFPQFKSIYWAQTGLGISELPDSASRIPAKALTPERACNRMLLIYWNSAANISRAAQWFQYLARNHSFTTLVVVGTRYSSMLAQQLDDLACSGWSRFYCQNDPIQLVLMQSNYCVALPRTQFNSQPTLNA